MEVNPTRSQSGKRLLSYRDVQERVLFSDEHIRRLVKAGRFPPPVKLGLGKSARVGWPEEEINKWIEERAREAGYGGEAA